MPADDPTSALWAKGFGVLIMAAMALLFGGAAFTGPRQEPDMPLPKELRAACGACGLPRTARRLHVSDVGCPGPCKIHPGLPKRRGSGVTGIVLSLMGASMVCLAGLTVQAIVLNPVEPLLMRIANAVLALFIGSVGGLFLWGLTLTPRANATGERTYLLVIDGKYAGSRLFVCASADVGSGEPRNASGFSRQTGPGTGTSGLRGARRARALLAAAAAAV